MTFYRSPVSHLVFDDRESYKAHVHDIAFNRVFVGVSHKQFRALKQRYLVAREHFHGLASFDDIVEWLNDNRDLIPRAPCLTDDALGNSRGEVARYTDLKLLKPPKWVGQINHSLVPPAWYEYETRINGEQGWQIEARIGVPHSTDPRFKIIDQCRGLTAYGFLISEYNFERDKDTGEQFFDLDGYILVRDFPNLAMMEKLAGRVDGNMLEFAA